MKISIIGKTVDLYLKKVSTRFLWFVAGLGAGYFWAMKAFDLI